MSEKQFNNPLPFSEITELFGKDGTEFGKFNAADVFALGESGRLKNIIYMTESGVYEKPEGLKFIIVKLLGGSGSVSGKGSTIGENNTQAIGPSGPGGMCIKKIEASLLSGSEIVTIGLGGIAAAASASGNTGETTSFGIHCSATGGEGTIYIAPGSGARVQPGANGGIGVGGDLNLSGIVGGTSFAAYYSTSPAVGVYVPGSRGLSGGLFGNGMPGTYQTGNTSASASSAGNPGGAIIEEYE